MAAEAADSLSASKELNEAANWLKAASSGNEDEDEGVEGLEEKSRLEDIGDDEFEEWILTLLCPFPLPFPVIWFLF